MKEEGARGWAGWLQFAITTAIGIAWNAFDRWAQLQPVLETWVPLVSPFVYIAVGAALGFVACKMLDGKRLADKDAEIERLNGEISRLKAPGAYAAVETLAGRLGGAAAVQAGSQGPSIDALISIGRYRAAGVLDALRRREAGEEYVKFGDAVEASLDLIEHSNGIIERSVTYFMGYHDIKDEYCITPEWAAFLSVPENRRALEELAGSTRWPR